MNLKDLSYFKVKSALDNLAKTVNPGMFEDIEMCPVCFTPPENDERVRLQVCGHLYCLGCLNMAIESSSWPLVCAAEVCQSFQKNIMLIVNFELSF